jgi:hypothetical protein
MCASRQTASPPCRPSLVGLDGRGIMDGWFELRSPAICALPRQDDVMTDQLSSNPAITEASTEGHRKSQPGLVITPLPLASGIIILTAGKVRTDGKSNSDGICLEFAPPHG